MTRRQFLSIPTLALPVSRSARGQRFGGMASRKVTPAPRGKPSGLPFDAKLRQRRRAGGICARP